MIPPPAIFGTHLSQSQHGSSYLSIISNQNNTNVLFPGLAPALVRKDHSVWCTERFFLPRSRDFDWDTCLWQLWLDRFGDLNLLRVPNWTDGKPFVFPMNSAVNKQLQRLSLRYRYETCVLASKRLDALKIADSKEKAAWLKRVCEKTDS